MRPFECNALFNYKSVETGEEVSCFSETRVLIKRTDSTQIPTWSS